MDKKEWRVPMSVILPKTTITALQQLRVLLAAKAGIEAADGCNPEGGVT